MIPYGRQLVSEQDIEAVCDVLRSDFLTQGPMVPAFEQALADYTGAGYAVCANSATSALHAACVALNVDECSRVWVSANTFVASANCAAMLGASIDFIDVDPQTGNISAETLQKKLQQSPEQTWPTHIIVVHFAGNPCDMAAISSLLNDSDCRIIEDASHALGAEANNCKVGGGKFSDISVFSFHPVKMITSGEGGCALTSDVELAQRMRCFISHDIERDPQRLQQLGIDVDGDWFFVSQGAAPNYRLSDIHAALGLSQLQQLDNWVTKRRTLASYYDQCFYGSAVSPLQQQNMSSFHLYVVCLPTAVSRRQVFNHLRQNGVGVQVHYVPLYRHPHLQQAPLPGCEHYYQHCLTLPLHVQLEQTDLDNVVTLVDSAIKEYC